MITIANQAFPFDSESLVDYAFYTRFWSLQDFFREPLQCYSTPSWKKFSSVSRSEISLKFVSLCQLISILFHFRGHVASLVELLLLRLYLAVGVSRCLA